jgi:TRAP-type uncharacterized transport system substrate-binding protein
MRLITQLVICATLFSAAIHLPASASAQSLDDMLGSTPTEVIEIVVACGSLDKANCSKVLPRVAAQTGQRGVILKPIESRGSVQSATAVAKGVIPAAIGQRDAFNEVRRTTQFVNTFNLVGQPVYPYMGFLVSAVTADYDSIDEMVNETKVGSFRKVAAGKPGSGGQITLAAILDNYPKYKRVIQIEPFDHSTALDKLRSGELAAYFVMDGPDSALVQELKTTVDAKGNKVFKILEIDLANAFYKGVNDWNGKPLYYEQVIDLGGWFNNVTTIATDAVFIVNQAYQEKNVKAVRTIVEGIEKSQAAVRADLNTPKDWDK